MTALASLHQYADRLLRAMSSRLADPWSKPEGSMCCHQRESFWSTFVIFFYENLIEFFINLRNYSFTVTSNYFFNLISVLQQFSPMKNVNKSAQIWWIRNSRKFFRYSTLCQNQGEKIFEKDENHKKYLGKYFHLVNISKTWAKAK